MNALRQILEDHEKKIQTIMYHKKLDWEKQHLVWKHATSEWQRKGNEGLPYPEPSMYPEYIVRRDNDIHIRANDLKIIYDKLCQECSK